MSEAVAVTERAASRINLSHRVRPHTALPPPPDLVAVVGRGDSYVGREVASPPRYDPSRLVPIPRAGARAELGLAAGAALPFTGHDRWHA